MSQDHRTSSAELQTVLLGLLGRSKVDSRLGRGQWYLSEAMAKEFAPNQQPKPQEIMEAVWSLISQGLAYIDYSQPSADNWTLHLTLAGKSAANDQTTNPDSPDKYIHRLQHDVPNASDTVLRYVNEALASYLNRSYLASAVMLGVASEAAFLEMAEAFGHWLPSTEGTKFLTLIRKPNAAYLAKLEEYRKKLEPRKPDLPKNSLTAWFSRWTRLWISCASIATKLDTPEENRSGEIRRKSTSKCSLDMWSGCTLSRRSLSE